jgi:uncharacterized damage-inducible protein DinB
MQRNFRPGGVGAMMDELERAMEELLRSIESLQKEEYEKIRDHMTNDENCRSIQTILSHVISAGYGYANYIRASFSMPVVPYVKRQLSLGEVPLRAREMLDFTASTLDGKWVMSDEECQSYVIDTNWGTRYDLEQLLEHAIVHLLRHRRQIERWN